ncbi:hypothetical protein E4U30_000819 [Claviceps sp. LM220 group G6]|nr:hypothetical protein E4U15_004893 [Claviceps sp. LM218 group G6]KAG6097257.1 hypothetical protein E4U30_000819 [Claviceps sp. LM220 group G6]KAG6111302.1 hypothetical protein E4U31_004673 [Claviceps sp. LM219 group G6]
MPCFKGIAVSVHANGAPLPEYGVQKQSRVSRISSYIPVPQPQLTADSNKAEPSKFAISVTLLTPGMMVPHTAHKPTDDTPYHSPQFVGGLQSGLGSGRGRYAGIVHPYIPLTNSPNETIAAYIYFDGREKEEVATLLRPGEETWVNSRWVKVPDHEGGGLAEREFLFREVGLECWLNGLDLKGHDAAEKLEKRRQKFEKRRRRQTSAREGSSGTDSSVASRKDTARSGLTNGFPTESAVDSDSWSEDDDDIPEATGQIKVAMFRVLASGEIRKGEYSPQFGAHDGDEDASGANDKMVTDVDHTTSFATPKSLDPNTISTQTVTGIDGQEKPFAVFTFFYRGDRQLQKMGVLAASKTPQATPGSAKRRSAQLDFSSLGPIKAGGTVGFSAFRDQTSEGARRKKSRRKSNDVAAVDSDDEEDDDEKASALIKLEQDDKDSDGKLLLKDSKFGGELADGVERIHLKRGRSEEPDCHSTSGSSQRSETEGSPTPQVPASLQVPEAAEEGPLGSPLKKARPSRDTKYPAQKLKASQSFSAALDAAVSGRFSPTQSLNAAWDVAKSGIFDSTQSLSAVLGAAMSRPSS